MKKKASSKKESQTLEEGIKTFVKESKTLRKKIGQILDEYEAQMELAEFPEDGHANAYNFVEGVRALIEKK